MKLTCAEFEILLADWLDGALSPDQKGGLEAHLGACQTCAELARDAGGAMAFLERAQVVEPPPALVRRILLEATSGYSRVETRPSWFVRWMDPILQPRLAMGIAMTALSLVMLGRYAGIEIRQVKPDDFSPAVILPAAEDRAHRVWSRALKGYDNLKLVYDVQTRLEEWSGAAPGGSEQQ